jgi:hypothetical protein
MILCSIRKCSSGGKHKYMIYKHYNLHTPPSALCHRSIPKICKCSITQISFYSQCTHMICYSVRFLYSKNELRTMALGTNAFLLELYLGLWTHEIVTLRRARSTPKYHSAAHRHQLADPVGRCSWEGETGIYYHNSYCLISHRKKSPKGITRNNLLLMIKT